jgi:hypothetical protein
VLWRNQSSNQSTNQSIISTLTANDDIGVRRLELLDRLDDD